MSDQSQAPSTPTDTRPYTAIQQVRNRFCEVRDALADPTEAIDVQQLHRLVVKLTGCCIELCDQQLRLKLQPSGDVLVDGELASPAAHEAPDGRSGLLVGPRAGQRGVSGRS